MTYIRALAHTFRWQIIFGLLIFALLCVLLALWTQPAATHGSPIIDGAFTGDWCAPNNKGLVGPDSFSILTPPSCTLGTEFMWDDFDFALYGGGVATDIMGYLVLPPPPGPPIDTEIDLSFVATTADANNIYFAVALGMFPAPAPGPFGAPPNVQIAIDVTGPGPIGASVWYDPPNPPPPGGTGLIGMAAVPGPLWPEYLISTDVLTTTALLFESLSVPGTWTLIGRVPQAWSGLGVPGVIEIAVPWGLFLPIPPFVPGTPLFMTVMSAHSRPCPLGPSCAPLTPEEDVFSSVGPPGAPPGFTTSPNVCPPGPGSSACELFPAGGPNSADAFVTFAYPLPPTPTPTFTNTPTPTVTDTPTPTSTPTRTATPTRPSATPTPTPWGTSAAGEIIYLPYVVKAR